MSRDITRVAVRGYRTAEAKWYVFLLELAHQHAKRVAAVQEIVVERKCCVFIKKYTLF
eukprot:SAG25_NODE_602_length_6631_cov_14.731323_5_plen_58_part_00